MPRDSRLKSLYLSAVALPRDRRDEFVREHCGDDAGLRAELERLLAAGARPIRERTADESAPPGQALGRGSMVGHFKILEQIGEGSFGTVFLAEQRHPVVRRVALKVLKSDLVGRDVLARFEAERQALALMDHPHIAKILDAGTDASGRPYFAMDLVVGRTITEYCDEHRLGIRARLELLEQVCVAIQHAHGKGVMHRDIKPSNMLVATRDGRPHATVIDFGIAKATQMRLTERTLATAFRAFVGTPHYMSPEQADGAPDIDTRTDIYSLGVLMYELLTSQTPFSGETTEHAGLIETLRIIRDVDPPKPSTKLASLSAVLRPAKAESSGGKSGKSVALDEVARQRSMDPRHLASSIRGELDCIVMKAINKVRSERYATANALASDIRRYLDGQPVSAAPPSAWYWASKIVRRNRLAAGIAAAALVTLLGTAIVASIGWRTATENEGRAVRETERAVAAQKSEEQQRSAAEAARHEAEDARQGAQTESYIANIRLAEGVSRRERDRVDEALGNCPESLRNWEWRYLTARSDNSVRVFNDHKAAVDFVAATADGRLIATGSADFSVRLWDVASGRCLRKIEKHEGTVLAGAFTSDGSRLVTASADGTVRVFNTSTGLQQSIFQDFGPTDVALSPDDRLAAVACNDGKIRLLDLAGVEPPIVLDAHKGEAWSVAFSRDGALLATGGADDSATIWDVQSHSKLRAFTYHEAPVYCVAFAPDGRTVASGSSDGVVFLWDPATAKPIRPLPEESDRSHAVIALAYSPDGRELAIASSVFITLRDVATGVSRGRFVGHGQNVYSIAYLGDGQRLVSASADGTARLWDTRDVDARWNFEGSTASGSWAVSHDGTRAVLLNGRLVEVRDPQTGAILGVYDTPGLLAGKAWFTPAGDQIVVLARPGEDEHGFSGEGLLLDAWSGAVTGRLKSVKDLLPQDPLHDSAYHDVAFSPDGTRVASPALGWRTIVLDWSSGERVATLQGHEGSVNCADFSPDGTLIVTASDDGDARVWRASDGTCQRVLKGHHGPVASDLFSDSGAVLATAGRDRAVRVWRVADGTEIGRVELDDPVESVLAVSDNGRVLLLAVKGGAVQLWDAVDGMMRRALPASATALASYSISPDATRILSMSRGGQTRLWTADSGRELLAQEAHDHDCTAPFVAFLGDGERVLSSCSAGSSLWDIRPAAERSRALDEAEAARAAVESQIGARISRGQDLSAIRADVARDPSLSDLQRRAALALLTEELLRRRREADHLSAQSDDLASSKDADPAAIQKALEMAREAHQLEPEASHRTTSLGVALYRAGLYQEAIETLQAAERQFAAELNRELTDNAIIRPQNAAYIVMSRSRLGQRDEAAAELERLRVTIATDHQKCGCVAFLLQAEKVVASQPGPADSPQPDHTPAHEPGKEP